MKQDLIDHLEWEAREFVRDPVWRCPAKICRWARRLLLGVLLVLALLCSACNGVQYRETRPDGTRIEATACYLFTGSDTEIEISPDGSVRYGRRQRISAETLNKAFDAIKALAEAAP